MLNDILDLNKGFAFPQCERITSKLRLYLSHNTYNGDSITIANFSQESVP